MDNDERSKLGVEHQINYGTNSVNQYLEKSRFESIEPVIEISKANTNKRFELSNNISATNAMEKDKLYSQLDTAFVKNLIKIQNDPTMKNLLYGGNQLSNKIDDLKYNKSTNDKIIRESSINAVISNNKEKINKNIIKNYYKPDELDLTKISYTNDLIRKVYYIKLFK